MGPLSVGARSFTKPGRFVAPSAPGALGHDHQSLLEMAPGLFDIAPSDAGHCHGSGDDHISQFGEEVIPATADPCASSGRACR